MSESFVAVVDVILFDSVIQSMLARTPDRPPPPAKKINRVTSGDLGGHSIRALFLAATRLIHLCGCVWFRYARTGR